MTAKIATPTMYAVCDSMPRMVPMVGRAVSVGFAELVGCVEGLVVGLVVVVEELVLKLALELGLGDGSRESIKAHCIIIPFQNIQGDNCIFRICNS